MKFPRRDLTDGYVAGLTRSVELRLRQGEDLHTAMADTLRERAPVAFRSPQDSGTSSLGWLLGFGLLTAAGAGLYFMIDRLLGQNPVEMIQNKFGGNDHAGGFEPGDSYSTVHGTAGAQMPDPRPSQQAESAFPTGPSTEASRGE